MRSFSHWTPRYLVDRARSAWFYRRNPEAPWLTPQAIEILDSWLRPTDRGIEWGSGRSTLWLGKRVGHLLSVESDPVWHAWVSSRAPAGVDCRCLAYVTGDVPDAPYVRVGAEVADGSLDFALVDGIVRDHCALLAIDKVRPGGLLVIDNANWFFSHKTESPSQVQDSPTWRKVREAIAGWRLIWTSNGVTDTAMWVKPL